VPFYIDCFSELHICQAMYSGMELLLVILIMFPSHAWNLCIYANVVYIPSQFLDLVFCLSRVLYYTLPLITRTSISIYWHLRMSKVKLFLCLTS
jgi:hypothetical protein